MIEWNRRAFKKMKNLKTLIIKGGNFSKDPKYLPNSLRVLKWWRYPSCCLPSDFHPKKLAICKLPYSSFTSFELDGLWKASLKSTFFWSSKLKSFTYKIVDYSFCSYFFSSLLFFFFVEVRESKSFKL